MPSSQKHNRTLVRIEVQQLLDRFDHCFKFDPEWEFLIIHGPNGVGKTKLLELLNYAFTGQFLKLARLPFQRARFTFDDNAWIEIEREVTSPTRPLFDEDVVPRNNVPNDAMLYWRLKLPREKLITYNFKPELDPSDLRQLDRIHHEWPIARIGPQHWIDHSTGEELDSFELAERYGVQLSSREDLRELSPRLASTLDAQSIHLIQTQRLLNIAKIARRRDFRNEGTIQEATVVAYAEDLSRQLKAALAENSRRSQDLDRSFPSRLFGQPGNFTATESEMRAHYDAQLELRSKLAEIDILDKSLELPLPNRPLESWELRALSTYLADTDEKLQTFQGLLNKVELIRDIVDRRFLFKTLEIGQEFGFAFRNEDSRVMISPKELSSGEQHQLVLMYDLLMNVDDYTLVLIDEPEISLHIDWQTVFLEDLHDIAKLRNLRFIIATHSPQIIGNWWHRTARLYDSSPSG